MAEENNTKTSTSPAPAQNGQRGGRSGGFNQRGGGRPGGNNRRPRREPVEVVKEPWVPKTELGKKVLAGKYTTIRQVLLDSHNIVEPEIAELLIPDLETEFINVGQAKGKFGGGKRKTSKATQRKTREGSRMSFQMIVVSGNKDGVVGLGFGKARETVPSREKAIAKAKQNLIVIRRGSGSWEASATNTNSIPFKVEGRSGSCKVRLMPAPPGTGLVIEAELRKMLELAGIKDIWSKTFGSTKNKVNLMKAGFDALSNLQDVKLNKKVMVGRAIKEGSDSEL